MKQNNIIIILMFLITTILTATFIFLKINRPSTLNTPEVKSLQTDTDQNLIDFSKLDLTPKKINNTQPKVYSKYYILLDQDTFYPLLEKDSNVSVPIASTTKIMTAIIVLENYSLSDIVEVSQKAASQTGSDTFLKTGEKLTVENLLYALLVKSGNDSAMTLAEHYSDGGLEGFIKKMNDKAQYLGLKNTKFRDPAGLDDEGLSSAFDLAVTAAYAMKYKKFADIVKTSEITITSTDGKIAHKLETSNRLIESDHPLFLSSVKGIKTGFTYAAGHCLVSLAENNGHGIIAVILNTTENSAEASAKESKKLLEWGMNSFKWN